MPHTLQEIVVALIRKGYSRESASVLVSQWASGERIGTEKQTLKDFEEVLSERGITLSDQQKNSRYEA